jgi:hypothetical protein
MTYNEEAMNTLHDKNARIRLVHGASCNGGTPYPARIIPAMYVRHGKADLHRLSRGLRRSNNGRALTSCGGRCRSGRTVRVRPVQIFTQRRRVRPAPKTPDRFPCASAAALGRGSGLPYAPCPGNSMVPGKLTVLLKRATPRRCKDPDYMQRVANEPSRCARSPDNRTKR